MIASKVEQVCAEYFASTKDLNEPYDELLQRLLTLLQDFPNAPFTVQRLCELLLDPHRIYATSTRKVASAIEKLLTVSSTVPLMQVAPPRAGTYQAASEAELKTLVRLLNRESAPPRLSMCSAGRSVERGANRWTWAIRAASFILSEIFDITVAVHEILAANLT